MNAEWIIVYGVLTAAVGYAAWRIYKAIRRNNDPCYGCIGCELKDMKRQMRRQKLQNGSQCNKK